MRSFVRGGDDRPGGPVPGLDEALGDAVRIDEVSYGGTPRRGDASHVVKAVAAPPCSGLETIDQEVPFQDSMRFSVAPLPLS